MKEPEIRQIPLTALFIAIAILFPQLFHFFNLGSAFLPMFLPVMIGSMFLSYRFVALMAIIAPLISWLLTGMPPIAPPILPVLMLELLATGLVISILRQRTNLPVWLVVLISIIADRTILYLFIELVAPLMAIDHPVFSIVIIFAGIPGIILQFILIPITVYAIEKKYPHWKVQKNRFVE